MENKKTSALDTWINEEFAKFESRPASGILPARKIGIISTPRCGSTWFCESLALTGLFGDPSEWLNPLWVRAYMQHTGQSSFEPATYLQFISDRTTTANGVFAINFHVGHYLHWKKHGFDLLRLRFDNLIYLYRRDKIAQAYSHVKARMSNQWRSYHTPDRTVDPDEITAAKVAQALQLLSEWDEFFEKHLSPLVGLTLAYEDICSDPRLFHKKVFDLCGIDGDPSVPAESQLHIQRSAPEILRINQIKSYFTGSPVAD